MAKYEYRAVNRSIDNLKRMAEAGWRLHTITEQQQVWEREVEEDKQPGTTPGSVKFDPFVRAQAEGDPLPGETTKQTVVGSYVPHGLETALIELLEQREKRREGIANYAPSGIDNDLTNLRQALQSDTWLLMTCEAPSNPNPQPSDKLDVEIENLNSDVFLAPATTVSRVLNEELAKVAQRPPEPTPPWTAGWMYVGNDGAEFRVSGTYLHCVEEWMDSLQRKADGDVPPSIRADLMEAQRVWRREHSTSTSKWTLLVGDILVWIKPL